MMVSAVPRVERGREVTERVHGIVAGSLDELRYGYLRGGQHMIGRKLIMILGLALLLAICAKGFDRAGAQLKSQTERPEGQEITIYDASGRAHKIMLMHMSHAERKEAGKRLMPRLENAGVREEGKQ
jgi:hypothetical protein